MKVKRIILLSALVIFQLCFSNTLLADKPSQDELLDQGYLLVCDLETPPLDKRKERDEKLLYEKLEKQTTTKGIEKYQKRIEELHSDWGKKAPKIALAQFLSTKLKFETTLPIKLNTERKHKLEKGKYYSVKLIRPKTLKSDEGFLLPASGRLTIINKEEETRPSIFENIDFGISKWSPNVDTEGIIKLVDCTFISQESVTSPTTYIKTTLGKMKTGGGTRKFTVYEMLIQNSSDKNISSAKVMYSLVKVDGEFIESTTEVVTYLDWLPLDSKKIRIECTGTLDDLKGSIKVISMKQE
jgi:hypothetical protein